MKNTLLLFFFSLSLGAINDVGTSLQLLSSSIARHQQTLADIMLSSVSSNNINAYNNYNEEDVEYFYVILVLPLKNLATSLAKLINVSDDKKSIKHNPYNAEIIALDQVDAEADVVAADVIDPINFKPAKHHRFLDSMSRMIAQESGMLGTSIATAWEIKDDKFVLLFSFNKNNDDIVKKIVSICEKIIKKARYLVAISHDLERDIKSKTENIKVILQEIKDLGDENQFKQLRKKYQKLRHEIDLLKLGLLLMKDEPSEYEKKIIYFFVKGFNENIKYIPNKKGVHSELNLIGHCLNSGIDRLEKINVNGQMIPYQYIGNSLKNCGKCAALINGCKKLFIVGINDLKDKYHAAFFSRGRQDYVYLGSYYIPQWVLDINHIEAKKMVKLLKKLPKLPHENEMCSFVNKNHDISDPED